MKILALGSYLTFVWLLFGAFCLAPMEALALQATQYARVVAEAERIAYLAAKKSTLAAKIATAAVAANPTSTALRFVAGPLGWAALGVSAGLVIAQIYYSPSDLQTLKQAASPGTTYSIQGYTLFPVVDGGNCPSPVGGCAGQWAKIQTNKYCDLGLYNPSPVPAGWNFGGWVACGPPSFLIVTGGSGFQASSQEATQTQVQQYVETLPASDPQSLETHSGPVGQGQTPQGADGVDTQPVAPNEMPTQVKQKPVPSGDSIVADNVPPPSGTQQQTTGQQQTTTTTTTTQNPDGSTTTQEDTQTTVSCLGGAHDSRTLGTVLLEHQAIWNSSGLLAAVNLLKTLTWPSTLPVISLPSSFFGSQSVDFNQWAWFFTALRTLVIAGASLMAYRIIFVGGR
jgi:hypothetical protein